MEHIARRTGLIFLTISTSVILVGIMFLTVPRPAFSDSATPITGYAWSDNIGWISLNCSTDPQGCSTAAGPWGLSIDNSGNVTGYAWSDNIGWIEFGGLSGFPTGNGTSAQNAQIVGGDLIGWARACAGTVPGDCSSMASRTDGWDGWISLSGTSPSYGPVLQANGTFSCPTCFAWGSDVVGWIDFSLANTTYSACAATPSYCVNAAHSTTSGPPYDIPAIVDSSCNVTYGSACSLPSFCSPGSAACLFPSPTVITPLTAIPDLVQSGGMVTLTWDLTNVQGCKVTGNNGDGPWAGDSNPPGGQISGPITQQTTYTLDCVQEDPSQPDIIETAVVNVVPAYHEI